MELITWNKRERGNKTILTNHESWQKQYVLLEFNKNVTMGEEKKEERRVERWKGKGIT